MMADWNLHGLLDSMAPIADRVHLLVGSADTAIAPSQAKLVKRRHRQIEISLLDGLGHLAQEEAPTLVTDRLRRILGSPHASGR
jgi:pimeloyl-ACP methyl ester carboxylesterase